MRSCGIVAEYNPFHNGHQYQISEARKASSAEVMIVAMSGNFLQRGEPAIIDKWKRAEAALNAGADLVVELPIAFSVQPADYFAKGSIALLQELGCTALSFGSESGTGAEFHTFAQQWLKNEAAIETAFQTLKNNGSTYASQMQAAVKSVVGDSQLDLAAPNTILGLAYAKENVRCGTPMELFPVKRVGAGYNEQQLREDTFQSATALRRALLDVDNALQMQDIQRAVPKHSYQLIKDGQLIQWESFWHLLKYQITVRTEEQLRRIYQMKEGIEHRLKEKVGHAQSFSHFVELVKSKRYPWVRLQRLFVYVLLQITDEEMMTALRQPKAIRILGFTTVGQQYLSEMKKDVSIPIISRLNQKNKALWELDIRAGKIYSLASDRQEAEQDFQRLPIMV